MLAEMSLDPRNSIDFSALAINISDSNGEVSNNINK